MSQTVLVADDSQTIRKVVQMALKASDYEVVGVGSAREAVEAAKQQPSVILLDYYMPDGSGYDVCRAIKQDTATSDIPVIMLGGSYKEFDAGQARNSGASNVVMKPFKTEELVGAIDTAVNEPAAAQPQQAAQPSQPQSQPQQRQSQPSQPQSQPQQRQSQPSQPQSQPQQRQAQKQSRQAGSGPSKPAPNSPAAGSSPGQTPVPESQPRIPVNSGSQSRAPSGASKGSQPRIPGSGSTPGQSVPDSKSGPRQRKPTPIPVSGSGGSGPAPMSRDEIESFIRDEIKDAVREELPGMLRSVMGEIFQKKVLPKLVRHSEQKIQETLDERLDEQVTRRVRMELERLLNEE